MKAAIWITLKTNKFRGRVSVGCHYYKISSDPVAANRGLPSHHYLPRHLWEIRADCKALWHIRSSSLGLFCLEKPVIQQQPAVKVHNGMAAIWAAYNFCRLKEIISVWDQRGKELWCRKHRLIDSELLHLKSQISRIAHWLSHTTTNYLFILLSE